MTQTKIPSPTSTKRRRRIEEDSPSPEPKTLNPSPKPKTGTSVPIKLVTTEVPGLFIYPDAISTSRSRQILNILESDSFREYMSPVPGFGGKTSEKSRRVAHFGWYYSYKSKSVASRAPQFPTDLDDLIKGPISEVLTHSRLPESLLNQIIVNRYLPGQGISAHVDLLSFGPIIVSATFGSGRVMRFTHPTLKTKVDVYTPEGSVYIMSGDARNVWKHEMPGRISDNVEGVGRVSRGTTFSVTFRTVHEDDFEVSIPKTLKE